MNTSIKLTAGSILATAAVVVSSAAAFAGEGGAAGSVAIILTGPNPSQVSTSMATGKNSAAAASRTDGNATYTSAIGGAGALQVTDANTANVGYAVQADTALNTAQANELTGGSMSNGSVTLPGAEFPPAAPTPANR